MLINVSNHSTSSVWEWKASLSPKSQDISYPGKKYPTQTDPKENFPTRTDPKENSPTRPDNILKNVPWPSTGFGPVRSGETWSFGLPRRSLMWMLREYGNRFSDSRRICNSLHNFNIVYQWYCRFGIRRLPPYTKLFVCLHVPVSICVR